jgi:guanylate kinase|tara:strand:- start:732 stop:1310 length:579 start_codon:yes stop_codon:yes gene_type:complete
MLKKDDSIMVILSSPSGAGKTTISKKIQQKYQNFKISVSHTTRKPRPNEVEGIDYFFLSNDQFKDKIKNNEFYEHAKIFGNYYGTSKKSVIDLLKNKNDVLFDIDWQGTQQLSKHSELKLTKIFILPPSKEELKKRLIQRNQDKPEIVLERLDSYENDLKHKNDYDYVVINDNLEICFKKVEEIILFEKSKV